VDSAGFRAAAGLPAPNVARPGAVVTYGRDPSTGTWSLDLPDAAPLEDLDPQGADEFGTAVAIEGDILAVGAPGRQTGPFSQAGSVSIFEWTGGQWVHRQRIVRPGADQVQARFGASVDLIEVGGEWTLAVGCPGGNSEDLDDPSFEGEFAGEVFLFTTTDPAAWPTDPASVRRYSGIFESPPSASGAEFGAAVALDGDTLVVGAPFGNDDVFGGPVGPGAAYVYERVAGAWPEDSAFFTPRAAAGFAGLPGSLIRFGSSVDVDGDTLAIGAPRDAVCCDGGSGCQNPIVRGSVTIAERIAGQWTDVVLVAESTCAPDADFGAAVALRDGRLFAGAPAIGEVAVLDRQADGTWTLAATILETADQDLEVGFGSAVAAAPGIGGGTAAALVGWPAASGSLADAGAVYDWADPLPEDCDTDGVVDACQIADDPSLDCNGDGKIDSCQTGAPGIDCDGNGIPDTCELAVDPSLDCNGDGVIDDCQTGVPGIDCDGNGIPDTCELVTVEIVWLVDASGSQSAKFGEICQLITDVEHELADPADPDATRVLVRSDRLALVADEDFVCASDPNGVFGLFGGDVSDLGFPSDSPPDFAESWTAATAIIARDYPWRTRFRVVIPIGDECGWNSSTACDQADIDAITAARDFLRCTDVIAFPIQFAFAEGPGGEFREDVTEQMRRLAGEFRDPPPPPAEPLLGTGGRAFSREDGDAFVITELAQEIRRSLPIHDNDGDLLLDACELAGDAPDPALQDCNLNWIDDAFEIRADIGMSRASLAIPSLPEECDVPCLGDVDGDRRVTFEEDLVPLLAAWGPCGSGDCPTDFDGDGQTGFQDLLALLANWDWCFDPPPCRSGSRSKLLPPQSITDCLQKYGADPVKLQQCIEAMILADTP